MKFSVICDFVLPRWLMPWSCLNIGLNMKDPDCVITELYRCSKRIWFCLSDLYDLFSFNVKNVWSFLAGVLLINTSWPLSTQCCNNLTETRNTVKRELCMVCMSLLYILPIWWLNDSREMLPVSLSLYLFMAGIHRGITLTRANNAELWCLLCC